jgi:serine/threonine protein kinase
MLAALRDAIDCSHGVGSPFYEWSFGETLGEGSFGIVRAVTRRQSGERAAVKVLSLSTLNRQTDARKAVERERRTMVAAMQALPPRAPLVRLLTEPLTFGDQLFFFLTPRCDGDLLQLLSKGAFSEAQAAAVTRGALLAIAALHRAGIVHLDVKPQNLLFRTVAIPRDSATRFDAHGVPADVLLADFGCARLLKRAPPSSSSSSSIGSSGLCSSGMLPSCRGGWQALINDGGGTLFFTPPEALEEGLQATSADVWAVGCVAFSLLHRRVPFAYEHESDDMVRLRILRAEPLYEPPPSAKAAGRAGSSDEEPVPPLVPPSLAFRSCLSSLLDRDFQKRPSAEEALGHPWLARASSPSAPPPSDQAQAFEVEWDRLEK